RSRQGTATSVVSKSRSGSGIRTITAAGLSCPAMEDRRGDDLKTRGIDATNQAFIRYDQVEKRQEYHLAEKPGEDAFDEDFRVATCDLGRALHGGDADRAIFAKELGAALSEIGFAILEGHGVPPSLYD